MNLLIKACTILQPSSPFHLQVKDVWIVDGYISKIGENLANESRTINGEGKFLSIGFFDLNANLGELGYENKEDFNSGNKAAAAGGFTGVAMMPNTNPAVDSKAQIEYIVNRAKGLLIDILPIGALSKKRTGVDLAEMYDMSLSGAIAFSDGNAPVQDAGFMERALLYSKGFDGLIMAQAEDASLAGTAKINEGVVSTFLGMKGIPNLAEELMVNRDIYLSEYTQGRLHFSTISTRKSVELIKQAKQKGLSVTCDVAAHHLVLTDEALSDFDSLYKVKPPLRTQEDVDALIEGLKDNTIDAIVSQHTPQEIELKEVEFETAAYGMLGLQTAFSLAVKAGLTEHEIVEKLAFWPREILQIKIPVINENENANLVLFDMNTEWAYNLQNNYSKSNNSPLLGKTLKGKIWLTINNNQFWENINL